MEKSVKLKMQARVGVYVLKLLQVAKLITKFPF